MKTFPARFGPFPDVLQFELEEIENICLDALAEVKLLPNAPGAVRIDRFVEKRFGLAPEYRNDLPPGILGYSKINSDGPQAIVLNQQLSENPSAAAERRVRTTIAHEAGHCLLHATLYISQPSSSTLLLPPIMCRDEDVHPRTKGNGCRWWEFQANCAMAALLLPKPLLLRALDPFFSAGRHGGRLLVAKNFTAAVQAVAQIFDVNPVVARLRLEGTVPLG